MYTLTRLPLSVVVVNFLFQLSSVQSARVYNFKEVDTAPDIDSTVAKLNNVVEPQSKQGSDNDNWQEHVSVAALVEAEEHVSVAALVEAEEAVENSTEPFVQQHTGVNHTENSLSAQPVRAENGSTSVAEKVLTSLQTGEASAASFVERSIQRMRQAGNHTSDKRDSVVAMVLSSTTSTALLCLSFFVSFSMLGFYASSRNTAPDFEATLSHRERPANIRERTTFTVKKQTQAAWDAGVHDRKLERGRRVSMEENALRVFHLWMLDEDAFDEPSKREHWLQLRFWIDSRGVLNYWSVSEERVVSTFDILSISRLLMQRLPEDATCFPYACSIAFQPSVDSLEDINPTFLAADDDAALKDLLDFYAHFQKVDKAKGKAFFVCKLQRKSGDGDDPWMDIDMWIDERGIACWDDSKYLEIKEMFDAQPVGRLQVEMQPKDEIRGLFCVHVTGEDSKPMLFGSENQEVISALSETCDDLVDESLLAGSILEPLSPFIRMLTTAG